MFPTTDEQLQSTLDMMKSGGASSDELKVVIDKFVDNKHKKKDKELSTQPQSFRSGLLESAKNLAVDSGKTVANIGATGLNALTLGNAGIGYGTDVRFKDDIIDKGIEGAKEGFERGEALREETQTLVPQQPGLKDDVQRFGLNRLSDVTTIASTVAGAGEGAVEDIISPTIQGGINSLSDDQKQFVSEKAQPIVDWYNNLDEDTKIVMKNAGIIGEGATTLVGGGLVKGGATKAVKSVDKFVDPLTEFTKKTANTVGDKIADSRQGISSSMLDSINKVKPSKQQSFIQMSGGDSIGEYLLKRDIIGTPKETIDQLAGRFNTAKTSLDDALKQVDGTFKPKSAKPVLNDMLEYFESTADKTNLKLTMDRIKKLEGDGLTLAEFNNIKRDFERTVRTGYLRDNNGVKIQRNTNLDNAMRQERNEIAKAGGFKNIEEISKEIQLAKEAMNSIDAKLISQKANNQISLTDNMLAIGAAINPDTAALLVGKKIMSLDKVQSWVVKALRNKNLANMKDLEIVPANIINMRNVQKRQQAFKEWLEESGIADLIRKTNNDPEVQKLLPAPKSIQLEGPTTFDQRAELIREGVTDF